MTEYENEPIRGLPGLLPAGEEILWQGSPAWRTLARTAFRTRIVAGYFIVLAVYALVANGTYQGVVMTSALGVIGVALLYLLAWASARTTVYTLTNRRIVLRIGIAVPKCFNLPLRTIGSVDLALRPDGTGDVALVVAGPAKLGILALWPHARPWKLAAPQPMLRAIPEAETIATLIARHCAEVQGDGYVSAPASSAPRAPSFAEAAAA